MFISWKKTTLLLAFCWSAGAGEVKPDFKFFPELPRKIEIGKTPETILMENGKVQFEIVVPAKASTPAKYAANEAANLLSKATGSKIKPVPAASGKVPAIIIGDVEMAKKAGIDLKKLDRDGFVIKTVGKNVLIIGRDHPTKSPSSMHDFGDSGERATLYGTYDFLERFAGIRFYFPGELGTIVPKRREWKLPAINIYDRPDKVQRSHYASWGNRAISLPKELGNPFNNQLFQLHMRIQSWTWPCNHGLEKLGLRTRFGKTHPEYFAHNEAGKSVLEIRKKQAEHLCFNSPVREEIYKDAIAFLSGRPASERNIRPYSRKQEIIGWHRQLDQKVPVFDLTPEDGYYSCQCAKCRKMFSGKNTYYAPNKELSNFMWHYYAEGAERVKGLGYIAAWIYWPTVLEPNFQLPDNILIVMCQRGPWSCGNEVFFQKGKDQIKNWGRITGNRIRLWNYMIKYPWGILPGVPSPAPHAVARYYKEVAPYICGAFSEVGMERFMFQYLNLYVYYKVLWDTNVDVEALLEEHYRLMFGKAAAPMKNFFVQLEKLWLGVIGSAVDTPEGPKAVIPSDLELWQNRYSDSKMKELEGQLKAAEAAVPANSDEGKRIRFIKREIWQPLADTRAAYKAAQDLKNYWNMYASEVTEPPAIDGKLNEKAWEKAKPYYLTRFQKDTVEVKTVVRMLYDAQNLYFSFECEEPDTANMLVQNYKNDHHDRWSNSTVEIFLNPDTTRKNYYQLIIDPAGKITDYRNLGGALDVKWNSNAEIKTTVKAGKKWIAEVRLPRENLNEVKPVFPVNFMRHRARLNKAAEVYIWNPFMRFTKEVDKWGNATLGPDPNPSVIRFSDFEAPIRNKRWIGPWFASKILETDDKIWLGGGKSVKMEGMDDIKRDIVQLFKLKPNTTYEISYFVKLDKVGENTTGGIRARLDEWGGNVTWIPKTGLHGTMPWTRISKIVKTSPKCGARRKGSSSEYLSIQMPKNCPGTAWIDHVEIREIKDAK